jgi:hypothetical protein
MIYGMSYEVRGRCTETSELDRRPGEHSTMISDIDPTMGVSSTVYCGFLTAAWLREFFFLKTMIDLDVRLESGLHGECVPESHSERGLEYVE